MTNIHLIILVLISIVGLQACQDKLENPNYSEIPYIELAEVEFVEADQEYSTLKVSIHFRDGDSDLGLYGHGEDTEYPYNNFFVKTDKFGNAIAFDHTKDVWSCEFWSCHAIENGCLLTTKNGDRITLEQGDAVAIEKNKFGRNFDVQLLVKENNIFKVFDFEKFCAPSLGGRFPRLDPSQSKQTIESGPFTIYQSTRWSGTITYHARNSAMKKLFGGRDLKIRVQIYDRALNESNIVESEPFTLKLIAKQ